MVNLWQPINFGGGMGSGGVIGTPGSSGGGGVPPNAGMWEGLQKIAAALINAQQQNSSAANVTEAIKAGQGWTVPMPGPNDMPQDAWAGPPNPSAPSAEPLAGQRLGGGMQAIASVLAQNTDPSMRAFALKMAIPKPSEEYTMAPGQARFRGGQKIADMPAAPEKEPNTVQLARAMGLKDGSPEWNAFIRDVALKPSVQIGDKTPIGKLLADRESLIGRGFGPEHPVLQAIDREIAKTGVPSGEQTRTQEMTASGIRTMGDVTARLMPGGKPDMNAIREMWAELPFTEGRTTASQMKEVASFILRLETGAQANEGEIRNTAERYMPKPWDNENTAQDKLMRLQKRFETARNISGGRLPTEPSPMPLPQPPLSSFEK